MPGTFRSGQSPARCDTNRSPTHTVRVPFFFGTSLMTTHDTRYRDLFSHVDMVRALFEGVLQACVDDDTTLPDVDELDWASAHMLLTSFVTDDLQQRHGDCIWQLDYRDGRR